eukprot:scaffold3572_cov125-Isochrysis_galbana.AAC.11
MALSALNISMVTSTESEKVEAVFLPLPVMYSHGLALRSSPPWEAQVLKSGAYGLSGKSSPNCAHLPQFAKCEKLIRGWPYSDQS